MENSLDLELKLSSAIGTHFLDIKITRSSGLQSWKRSCNITIDSISYRRWTVGDFINKLSRFGLSELLQSYPWLINSDGTKTSLDTAKKMVDLGFDTKISMRKFNLVFTFTKVEG
eukprot:TRINITY_DN25902_c0_g1_i1.p1 TRINITY_DN25902_c0_g1~~TRINITY_DN25902_c0_g1_i1.p1  ORF type:complete len:125 (-),score=25.05 TRINITY_DN25902_c0_g1_i1:132-476(-)